MSTTPNMSLILPTVGVTLGPAYAEQNNVAFESIDSHSHVAGEGVQVPTAGLNINANLEFNGFAAIELNATSFQTLVGTPAIQSLYSSGGDLYFKNAAGVAVALTVGNAIAGVPGTIQFLGDGGSSAVFSDLAEDFSWYFEGTKLAAQNMGDIRLFPFDGAAAYANRITIKAPTALAGNYNLTLPLVLPASTSLAQSTTAGVVTFSNTVLNPIFEGLGSVAAPSYSFTGDPDTGMYSTGANTLDFAAAGIRALAIGSTGIYSVLGTAALPSHSFIGDSNTGMYSSTADTINWSTGGTLRLSLTTTALTSTLPFSGTTGTFSGAVTAPSINLASGGAFKVKIVAVTSFGTLSFGDSVTRSAAHGLTSSSIRGMSAVVLDNVSINVFGNGAPPAGSEVAVNCNGTDVNIQLTKSSGGSAGYGVGYATIYYI